MAVISTDMSSDAAATYDYSASFQSVTVKTGVIVENTSQIGVAFLMDTLGGTLTNGGNIYGTGDAIDNDGGSQCLIRNLQSGYIASGNGGTAVSLGDQGILLNYGTIEAYRRGTTVRGAVSCYGYLNEISNYGTILGQVSFSVSGSLFNSGTIDGDVTGGTQTVDVVNRGVISGTVYMTGAGTYDGRGGEVGRVVGSNADQTYIIDRASFAGKIVEGVNGGSDTVASDEVSLNLALFNNIENLTLLGTGNFNLTGDAGANVLTGNDGRNVLRGGAGDDTYYVQNADDRVIEAANGGMDTVYAALSFALGAQIEALVLGGDGNFNGTGNDLANTITGNDGANVIDGGTGADAMIGGGGGDSYYVDDAGDTIVEGVGAGTDTVFSSNLSLDLGRYANVENATLLGTATLNLTGSQNGDILTGNRGVNTLTGLGGDDTYFVQNATDRVVEAADGGTDTVHADCGYTLAANVENLTLDGSADYRAAGNGLANVITGNSGANTIIGAGGNDQLSGGGGNDTFVYHAGFGRDTISGFAFSGDDRDVIQVDRSLFADYEDLRAHTVDTGRTTCRITYDADNAITLTGAQKRLLTEANFTFV